MTRQIRGLGQVLALLNRGRFREAAFVDGDPVRIPARLRYRIAGGGIMWFYQLYRWEFFLRERVRADLMKASAETTLPMFEGSPES